MVHFKHLSEVQTLLKQLIHICDSLSLSSEPLLSDLYLVTCLLFLLVGSFFPVSMLVSAFLQQTWLSVSESPGCRRASLPRVVAATTGESPPSSSADGRDFTVCWPLRVFGRVVVVELWLLVVAILPFRRRLAKVTSVLLPAAASAGKRYSSHALHNIKSPWWLRCTVESLRFSGHCWWWPGPSLRPSHRGIPSSAAPAFTPPEEYQYVNLYSVCLLTQKR